MAVIKITCTWQASECLQEMRWPDEHFTFMLLSHSRLWKLTYCMCDYKSLLHVLHGRLGPNRVCTHMQVVTCWSSHAYKLHTGWPGCCSKQLVKWIYIKCSHNQKNVSNNTLYILWWRIFKDVTEFTYGVCKVFPFKNVSWRQCVFSPLRDQSFCLVGCSVNKVSQFTASASNSHVVSTHLIAQTPTIYSYLFRKTSSYYFSVLISLSFIPLDPCNHYLNDSSQYYSYHDQNTPNCLQNVCKFHYIIFI